MVQNSTFRTFDFKGPLNSKTKQDLEHIVNSLSTLIGKMDRVYVARSIFFQQGNNYIYHTPLRDLDPENIALMVFYNEQLRETIFPKAFFVEETKQGLHRELRGAESLLGYKLRKFEERKETNGEEEIRLNALANYVASVHAFASGADERPFLHHEHPFLYENLLGIAEVFAPFFSNLPEGNIALPQNTKLDAVPQIANLFYDAFTSEKPQKIGLLSHSPIAKGILELMYFSITEHGVESLRAKLLPKKASNLLVIGYDQQESRFKPFLESSELTNRREMVEYFREKFQGSGLSRREFGASFRELQDRLKAINLFFIKERMDYHVQQGTLLDILRERNREREQSSDDYITQFLQHGFNNLNLTTQTDDLMQILPGATNRGKELSARGHILYLIKAGLLEVETGKPNKYTLTQKGYNLLAKRLFPDYLIQIMVKTTEKVAGDTLLKDEDILEILKKSSPHATPHHAQMVARFMMQETFLDPQEIQHYRLGPQGFRIMYDAVDKSE